VIRIAYLCGYAALAALAASLVGRPALLWVQSQGTFHTVLRWDVPYGALVLTAAALLAISTAWLASQAALKRRPRAPIHVAFLLLVGICAALRSASGNPRAPPDPAPSLLEALRIAADALDRGWAGQYAPDAGEFIAPLAQVPPPAFRRLGRPLPLHARVLSGAAGPQLDPLPGDQPGTIYVAVSQDRQTAWLTALALGNILSLPSGSAAVVEARGGTHALPGQDPALPAYPRMQAAPQRHQDRIR
jgi:hypothetical protein